MADTCGSRSNMKSSILILALFLAYPALSNNLLEDTAIIALKEAKHSPTGKTLEHGGMIFSRDGGEWGMLIEYVEPYPAGSAYGVMVINKDLLLPHDRLMATYHLHLCMGGYYHQVFSFTDIVVAVIHAGPEFMLDECTGDVHEFDPAVDRVHGSAGIDAHLFDKDCNLLIRRLPAGRIIGNIGETEEEKPAPEEKECVPDKK